MCKYNIFNVEKSKDCHSKFNRIFVEVYLQINRNQTLGNVEYPKSQEGDSIKRR